MFPEFYIANLIIPLYPFCVATGFLVGTLVLYVMTKKSCISYDTIFPLMCAVEIGVIVGGKLLFLLVNIALISRYYSSFGLIGVFSKTGFVFYGGLFGGVAAVYLFSKIKKMNFQKLLQSVLFVTPLIHAFGRIGCFCAGCCYGKIYDGFCSVSLHKADRFPVQLLEAGLNFALFLLFSVLVCKKNGKMSLIVPLYFVGYGSIRFVTEFFRGDEERGFIGFLSVSAWISIATIILGLVLLIRYFLTVESK